MLKNILDPSGERVGVGGGWGDVERERERGRERERELRTGIKIVVQLSLYF